MSERGVNFLSAWIAKNIKGNPYCLEDDSKIGDLTAKCIADAHDEVISIGEIEEDTGQIDDCILDAMEEVADPVQSIMMGGGRLA